MIQPKIRFNGFKDEWVEKKLGEVFKKESIKNSHLEYGSSKIISLANLYYKNDLDNVPSDSYMKTYNEFKVGDIAFEGNKNKNYRYGRFIANTLGDGVISHVFEVYKPKVVFDIHYLGEFINYEPIMGRILRRTTKSTTMMTSLVSSDFLKESVQLPSLPEQQKIGALFSKYDAIIALREQKLVELNALKKGMLQQMFDDGSASSHKPQVRFSGFNDEWVEKKLGEIAEIAGGRTPSTSDARYWDGGKDWYTPSDLTTIGRRTRGSARSVSQFASLRMWPENTILLSTRAGIGKMTILTKEASINQGLKAILLKKDFDPDFIYSYQPTISKQANRLASGSTFTEISTHDVNKIKLNFPTLPEQQKIGQLFKHLDVRISNEQSKIEQLKAQKQGLLQKMIS